ncbi:AbrB/MazE/SpoVT family DNA-binding domain-containing protein [Candidatus Woesearchaeota archaeon]|nr:AbrB/MazE/SpoVT family DNA-binding domain-containing protein [Candidatus Woesearchaeota archaeon]
MSDVELTKMSSKGQVVIPLHVRDELGLKEGETFAVMGEEDTIILKKVAMPSAKEVFERVHSWGTKFSAKKGLKEADLQAVIKRSRAR